MSSDSQTTVSNKASKIGMHLALVMIVLSSITGVAAAQQNTCQAAQGEMAQCNQLADQFRQMGNLVVFLVAAVAVPNGAYGFLEWMTASDSVDKDERGRRRIRNTFIALGGVGVLRIGVDIVIQTIISN